MIIVCKKSDDASVEMLTGKFESMGFRTHLSKGTESTIIGLIGDTSKISVEDIEAIDIVEKVQRVSEPYKLVNRKFHNDDTVIDVNGVKIGGGHFAVMAGPCSIESEEQIVSCAKAVKAAGANFLRGGAFKPRTSPYAFRGLKAQGLEFLLTAKKETGLPVVTELMSLEHLDLFNDVDIIQIGARNMQNFEMLAEIGKCRKPILLKRGLANTIEEWLMSAEYIMSGGNENVILCERGIRTFDTATRNTFDVSAIPVLHNLTHLPVIADPSHASGKSALVKPLAKSAVAAGADGLMIEVHPEPSKALCDGAQSLTPEAFENVMTDVRKLCGLENKIL
ncbi:3-deoxy-7-phosphoheptulonate synthase [Porcipelethomonas sp.]|uniref:3-deoxy-7-phosphoheptulonate synthase n=1 Tax=Porcipelethomonas sp. TaxID=2981675 RepID=UPI003EF663B1